ncbi:hypothetical protein RI129_010128 [Pyrocoelia pectoralis]|uniref:Ionotropic glutamate receptor C-terminal domain-containing protein n=1 Tax=Pyrocoelia pectoralis TaxID=417401 RepID=A0AAN7VAP0_9COLE
MVPAAKPQARWKRVANIFQINLWILTLISFMLVALVLCLFGFPFRDIRQYRSFIYCLMICFKSFFSQPIDIPRYGVLRLVTGVWILFGLIMTATFQGRLTPVFNFDLFEKQIANVYDLIESKIAFGIYKENAFFFSHGNAVDKFLYDNYVDCPIDLSCLNRTAFQSDFAIIKPKRHIEYFIGTIYMGKDGRPLIYMFKDNVCRILVTMAFPKGFPILSEVNKILLRLQVHGFTHFFNQKFSYLSMKAIQSAKREEASIKVLQINDVFWIFFLLFFGLGFAAVVFIIELLMFKYFKGK